LRCTALSDAPFHRKPHDEILAQAPLHRALAA
jgi:hypothetical protein